MCFKYNYDEILEQLKKYKDDEIFLKEVPNVNDVIQVLEGNKEKFKNKKYEGINFIGDNFKGLIYIVEKFSERREDIKWYYEQNYSNDDNRIRYEWMKDIKDLHDFGEYAIYSEYDEQLEIYNDCKKSYVDADYYLYQLDYLFIYLHLEPPKNEKCLVKFAMESFEKCIEDFYDYYENMCRENRDIFKEIEEIIKELNEYSKNKAFVKEVPTVFSILKHLKEVLKSKDEDKAYKTFYEVSHIREYMNKYNPNQDKVKYSYKNIDIDKLIKEAEEKGELK